MKVLFAVPYIYDKQYKEFTKNSTGLGIILTQIYEHIAKNNDAYLISHVLTKGHGRILPHTLGSVLRHMRLKDLIRGVRWAFTYKQGLSSRLRYFYFCINKGYVLHTIRRLQPDLVHIHGVNIPNRPYIEACEELGIKYVITLHGLKGLDESVKTPLWNKNYEKEVLLECEKHNIPVTVISTSIKSRIEKHYLGKESKCITVVTNGTNVVPDDGVQFDNLREKYKIPTEGEIAIAVGTVGTNKNQIQIVEAMPYVVQQRNLYVCICGTDTTDGKIKNRIEELGLTSRVFVLGFIPHEQLGSIYQQASFNILASINEGFGLSIIEAYVYGLPTVTFADLDAVPDLYNEDTVVLCENRNAEAFAEAIIKTMDKQWDVQSIREYSKNFSLEKMAENYQRVYKKTTE